MKAHQLSKLLGVIAGLQEHRSVALDVLTAIFAAAPATATIAAVTKKIEHAVSIASVADNPEEKFERVTNVLGTAATLASLASSAAVATACQSLAELARANAAISLISVKSALSAPARRAPKPLNEAAVDHHSGELLRRAPGTEGFATALQALKDDPNVKLPELKAIAERLNVKVPSDAKRAKLLSSIGHQHNVAQEAVAKAEALRGNSSA